MDYAIHTDTSFKFIWAQYRTWGATAEKLKKELTLWKIIILALSITGAFTAILSQVIDSENYPVVSGTLGWTSAVAIAISGYGSKKILTGEQEKHWLMARAAAETCKSNAYLYLFQIHPYLTPEDDVTLYEKIETLIRELSSVPQVTISQREELRNIPHTTFSFSDYMQERLYKQGQYYYLPKAAIYRKYVTRSGYWSIALGIAGFLLGVYGATSNNAVSVWIAFVSTVSASITTFISNNRYQYLAMSFRVMATQLKILWMKGRCIAKDDINAQKDFIKNCEDILNSENRAWLSELSKTAMQEESEATVDITRTPE